MKTLLIVHHEHYWLGQPSRYLIDLMRKHWEGAGWRIVDVSGVTKRVPADAVLLHVDLSVVPPEYAEFASRYPIRINAFADDIRKTKVSRNRVRPGDGYDGPVIVKTTQNSAGSMERRLAYPWWSLRGLIARRGWRFWGAKWPRYPYRVWGKEDYKVHGSAKDVPPEVFACPDLIVEKFLPEKRDDRYCLREWYFFGDASIANVELSDEPKFTSGESAPHLAEPIPADLVRFRREMKIDYGKIDYVMREGKAVVFDVNKTVGTRYPPSATAEEYARVLAAALSRL